MDQNVPSITGVFWFHFVFPFPTFVKGPNKMISTYVVLHARGFSQRQKENKSFKLSLERPLKSHAGIGLRLSPTSLTPENQPQTFCIPRWDWLLQQVYIQRLTHPSCDFRHKILPTYQMWPRWWVLPTYSKVVLILPELKCPCFFQLSMTNVIILVLSLLNHTWF